MDLFSTSEVLWGGNDAGKKIMGGAQNLQNWSSQKTHTSVTMPI